MPSKISLLPLGEIEPTGKPQPLMIAIKSKEQLYSFYMPQLLNGGLFIPTTSFGQAAAKGLPPPRSKIMLLLTLLDDPQRKTIQGEVSWIAHAPTTLGAHAGVGIHFEDNEASRQLKVQIENALAGILGKSDVRTQTF